MTTPTYGPSAADASLHLLVEHLADALADDELEPCLLHVALDDGGFDLGVLPLDGRHPTRELLGFTAPTSWHALGMATHGWAYHVDDRDDPDRHRTRVHTVTLVARSGEIAHRTAVDGDHHLAAQVGAETPGGEQIDLLHRCLGLPTDPEPCDAEVYWTVAWLAAVLDQPVPTTWGELVDRHPAMRLLGADAAPVDHDLPEVLASFHRVCSWSRLRRLTAEGSHTVPGLHPEDAGWLDDGAFARFVLSRCLSLATLRHRVRDELPATLADRVFELLGRLEIPERAWPDAPGSRSAA